ncbi:hypothetical protein Lepto7376_2373 [[Leptolyngbya] sp. PCC 7376]|nr:hypothetical protein Lepto7376_2373 [[Leptolyngbya] sp. PCC 7376]
MEEIRIKFTLKDYIDGNIVWHRQDKIQKLYAIFLRLVAIFFAVACVISYVLNDIPTCIFSLFFFVFSLRSAFKEQLTIPFAAKQTFDQCRKQFSQEQLFIFDRQVITIHSDIDDITMRWFDRHIITPDMLLIFTTPINFYLLPRKYFPSQEQYDKVCEIVRNFPQGQD